MDEQLPPGVPTPPAEQLVPTPIGSQMPPVVAATPAAPKSHWLVYSLVGVLLIILLLIGWYFMSRGGQPGSTPTANQTSSSATNQFSTYTNYAHGFLIQYPDWSVSTTSDKTTSAANVYTYQTELSAEFTRRIATIATKDGGKIDIIGKSLGAGPDTLENFLRQNNFTKVSETTVGGVRALEATIGTPNTITNTKFTDDLTLLRILQDPKNRLIIFDKGNVRYLVSLSGKFDASTEKTTEVITSQIKQQILASWQFL